MKQRTLFLCLIILMFAILLGVTACKSNDVGTVETTAEQTTVPTIQEATATETTDTTKTNISTTGSIETTQLPEPVDPLETEEDPWVTQNRVIPDVIPEFDETAYQVLSPQKALEQHGYFYKYEPQYRDTYYWVTPDLLSAANIGNKEYCQWIAENIHPNEINGIEPQEMYTVTFIKDFHISREAFEQACEEFQLWLEDKSERWAEGDAIFSMEEYEMPNADIIYTFDNEIINNYYRRVQ